MTNRIQWESDIVNEEVDQIEISRRKIDGVERMSYDLSEGMEIMDKLVSSKERAQYMVETYSKIIESDLGYIRAILEEVLELESSIAKGI